jgi:hypothetical protein
MRAAGDRPTFYSVTYIEPLAGKGAAAGLILRLTLRGDAVDAAVESDNVIATEPIRLLQGPDRQAGVLLIGTTSNGPTGPSALLVALRMGSFAHAALAPLQSVLGLRLTDRDTDDPFFDNLVAIEPLIKPFWNLTRAATL